MINIKNYLKKHLEVGEGCYAVLAYNGEMKLVWFTQHNFDGETWFLESPCELHKVCEVEDPIEEFCNEIVKWELDPEDIEDFGEEGAQEYINDWIKPMIVDNVYYEITNFQCGRCLPENVDDIMIISERECLLRLLDKDNEIKMW